MGQFTGMNIDEVRALASTMTSKAGDIDTIAQTVNQQLDSVHWVGTDHDTFANDWHSKGQTALKQVSDMLREAASNASRNASEQESASSK